MTETHRDSSVVVEEGAQPQQVAENAPTKWIATDPSGARHHLELSGGVVRCRGGDVHQLILGEVQAGRVGRIYGWWVKAE